MRDSCCTEFRLQVAAARCALSRVNAEFRTLLRDRKFVPPSRNLGDADRACAKQDRTDLPSLLLMLLLRFVQLLSNFAFLPTHILQMALENGQLRFLRI